MIKKITTCFLVLISVFLLAPKIVFAEKASSEAYELNPEDLVSSKVINIGSEQFIEEIYLVEDVINPLKKNFRSLYMHKSQPNSAESIDTYIYTIRALYPNGSSTITEDSSHISYVVNLRATLKYNNYGSTIEPNNIYKKITSLKYEIITIESPATMVNTKLTIHNNGITESGGGKTNQIASRSFGTAHSGTLNGISSWVPTIHDPNIGFLQVGIDIKIKRGTSYYESSWVRRP